MGKSKMRNLTIDNNGTSENWKWIISRENIIVQKENGKKQFIPNPNSERDSDNYVAITPGMIAEYIRTKILGLEPKVPTIKKTSNKVVQKERSITKSKIYIIERHETNVDEDYGDISSSCSVYEYWLDPAKAKIRAEELNKKARDMFIYDELTSIYTYSKYWHSNQKDELRFLNYESVHLYADTDGYKNVEEFIDKTNFRKSTKIGYEFRAIERELNL